MPPLLGQPKLGLGDRNQTLGGGDEGQESWTKEKQDSQACTLQVEHTSCQPASLNSRGARA